MRGNDEGSVATIVWKCGAEIVYQGVSMHNLTCMRHQFTAMTCRQQGNMPMWDGSFYCWFHGGSVNEGFVMRIM